VSGQAIKVWRICRQISPIRPLSFGKFLELTLPNNHASGADLQSVEDKVKLQSARAFRTSILMKSFLFAGLLAAIRPAKE